MTTRIAYSNDNDILEIRANILSLGVDNWTFKHQEAFSIINRVLSKRWYETVAAENGLDWRVTSFDPDKMHIEDVRRLACYKTLELAYLYLMNDAPEPDGFERQMKIFRELYNEELSIITAAGLTYDWDADLVVDPEEKFIRVPRRLSRV
jgi:hypothetical protein